MRTFLLALTMLAAAGCHNPTDYNAPGNPNAVPKADNNMLVQVDQARAAYTATLQIVAPILEANNASLAHAIPQAERDAVRQAITEAHNGLDEAESYARQNKSIDFGFVFDRVKSAINVITSFKLRHAGATTQPSVMRKKNPAVERDTSGSALLHSAGPMQEEAGLYQQEQLWESNKSSPLALRPCRQARNSLTSYAASRLAWK